MTSHLPKVSASRIMYIAAVQIVLTTVGFILYKRPYLWAWTALEYYKEVVCGENLDAINSKYNSYETAYKSEVVDKVSRYRRRCEETYLESFTDQFNEHCLAHCKSAFVGIPLASCFLILGIVAALQWAPYHHKTLKKPGFIAAFFFSLILVSINIGQIVSILVPMINPNATPDRPGTNQDNRAKCGYSTEVIALSLIVGSSLLSGLIALFVIRLYVIRVKYQDEHEHDLMMTQDDGADSDRDSDRKSRFLDRDWKEKETSKASKIKAKIKSERSGGDSGWGTPNSRYKGLT